jgi:hypothetical protein
MGARLLQHVFDGERHERVAAEPLVHFDAHRVQIGFRERTPEGVSQTTRKACPVALLAETADGQRAGRKADFVFKGQGDVHGLLLGRMGGG